MPGLRSYLYVYANPIDTYNPILTFGVTAMTKLTLSAESATIRRAKELAAAQKTSVSAIFARFVALAGMPMDKHPPLSPLANRATGLLPLGDRTEREVLEDALLARHGLA